MDKKITIVYCVEWNYYPRAASLAEAIKNGTDYETVLVPGRGGIFEVRMGDNLVFSKKVSGRFPKNTEILKALNGS